MCKSIGDMAKENKRLEDRIKRLEEELMDANNKYAVLVADAVLYEDRGERIKRLDKTLEAVARKLDDAWVIYMEFKESKP
jgi:archaellum component FlaC